MLDIPDELTYVIHDDQVKFQIDDVSSNWMSMNDSFIKRIHPDNLNSVFLKNI